MTKQKDLEFSEVKQGPPWTKVGVFQTFEEANKQRFEIASREPTFSVKVQRSGRGGEQFTVKKREDPELAKISKEIDEVIKNKPQKKKKLSKKTRKSK